MFDESDDLLQVCLLENHHFVVSKPGNPGQEYSMILGLTSWSSNSSSFVHESEGRLRGRNVTLLVAATAILVIGAASLAYVSIENSTVELDNPTVLNSSQYNVDLQFGSVANMAVRGSCPSVNGTTTTCDLMVQVALSTTSSGPNMNMATRSIGFTLLNSQFAQLAIASGQNIPETTPARASYSEDSSGVKSAMLTLPALVGGSSWEYDFIILNPPTVNGQASLNLVIDAQVVPTGFIGHSYQLEAQIQLSGS